MSENYKNIMLSSDFMPEEIVKNKSKVDAFLMEYLEFDPPEAADHRREALSNLVLSGHYQYLGIIETNIYGLQTELTFLTVINTEPITPYKLPFIQKYNQHLAEWNNIVAPFKIKISGVERELVPKVSPEEITQEYVKSIIHPTKLLIGTDI